MTTETAQTTDENYIVITKPVRAFLGVSLPIALKQKLYAAAKMRNRSMSSFVVKLLTDALL